MQSRLGLRDRLRVLAGYRVPLRDGVRMHGHLRVVHQDGTVMVDDHNDFVFAGLEALVDALQAAAYINAYKYIGFGTGTGVTEDADTALETELSGGTYARLTATQGEGDNARTYRLSGTWTNNSSSDPAVVTEYGVFSAATVGTMLTRYSTADPSPPGSKTVAVGETITITWDMALADA